MRGKNIVWLSLIAMLLCSALVGINGVVAQDGTTVYVDPGVTKNEDLALDEFTVTIEVGDVVNLWGWGVTVRYTPLMKIITPIRVEEGPFLDPLVPRPPGEEITFFAYSVDPTAGALHMGCSLLKKPGVTPKSGSGTLVTVTWSVLEAGSSDLKLENTKLIDDTGALILHEAGNGHYKGPESALMTAKVSDSKVNVGESVSFLSSARNFAEVPLFTRVRFDLMREDKLYTFYSGRRSLWASDPGVKAGWTGVGSAPYLNAIDGSYVQSNFHCSLMYWITFDTMPPLEPGEMITGVTMDAYCWASGPETEVDIEVYISLPSYGVFGYFLGAVEPYNEWSWISLDSSLTALLEEGGMVSVDKINDMQVFIHYWMPSGPIGDLVKVDALTLSVDVSPTLAPKEMYTYEPFVMGPFTGADVGVYYGIATVWFSYGGEKWNVAAPPRTFKFEVKG